MRCGKCPYGNEHIDYSTTDIVKCTITGNIHHSRDTCDCLDKNSFVDDKPHRTLFNIFKRKGARRS